MSNVLIVPGGRSVRARRVATSTAIAGMALGALLCLAGCKPEAEPRKTVPPPVMEGDTVRFSMDNPQLKVLRSEAAEEQTRESLRLPARVVWDESRTVRVFAPLSGRIVRLNAQAGDAVRAGAPLALLASPDLGQAQADARRAVVDQGLADKNLARATELHQAGVIALKELQQAQAERDRAEAERARAAERLKLYGGAENVDQSFALRAPIGGVVVERNANPGQEVRQDQGGSPLFVLSDPTRLWVQIDATESVISMLKVGNAIELASPALGPEKFKARIEQVSDFFDPLTRTLRVRASVDNAARKLKAEMFVSAEVDIQRGRYLRLPAEAVLLRGSTQYVFVDEGEGRFRRQKVVAEDGGFGVMRVTEGIKAGDKVVVEGGLLLMQLFGRSRG